MNDSKIAFLVPAWKQKNYKKTSKKQLQIWGKAFRPLRKKLLIMCMYEGLIRTILPKDSNGVDMYRCQTCTLLVIKARLLPSREFKVVAEDTDLVFAAYDSRTFRCLSLLSSRYPNKSADCLSCNVDQNNRPLTLYCHMALWGLWEKCGYLRGTQTDAFIDVL